MTKGSDKTVVEALQRSLERVLRPVVRILLRYGVTYSAFEEVARRVFVDVVGDEFSIPGRKLSASRIAILTGMSRRDVARVRTPPQSDELSDEDRINRAARVIAAWRRDPDFRGSAGRPRTLPFEGDEPTFSGLVKRCAGDVPARAALDELLRVGAAERTKDGRIKLIARAYVPTATDIDTIGILGSHVPDLVGSIDHNLTCEPGEKFFQRRVAYAHIPTGDCEALRASIAEQGQELLERLSDELAAKAGSPEEADLEEDTVRVVLGMYYLEEDAS